MSYNQRDVKRPPQPFELAPPRQKASGHDVSKRKLAPLPEIGGAKKPSSEASDRNNSHHRDAQERNVPYSSRERDDYYRQARRHTDAHRPAPRGGRGQDTRSTSGRRRSRPQHRNSLLPKNMDPRIKKFLNIGVTAAILGTLGIMIVLRFFSFNALAVYLDDELVGHIALDRALTSEEFHDEAIEFHAARTGDIRTTQRVTVTPARWVAARDISARNEVFNSIGFYLEYDIMARAIYVNGNREGLVRSDQYVNQIILLMTQRFRNENTIHYEFTAEWEIRHVRVNPEEEVLLSTTEAIAVLDRNVMTRYPYVVRSGDSWGAIATRFGTYPTALANLNNMTINDIIHPGQTLYVNTFRPLLSVVTVDKVVTIEDTPPEVEELLNPDLPAAVINVIEEGTPGQRQVSQLITYINGVQRGEPEDLEEEILRFPTTRIIEVGTRE